MLSAVNSFFSNPEQIIFFVLALIAISGAVFMISLTKVVHMVLSMAVTFLSLAGLYVLLDAEFIAFVQVLIYAGAITILMMFGIMLTKHDQTEEKPKRPLHQTLLGISVVLFFGILFLAIQQLSLPVQEGLQVENNTAAIGEQLFTLHVIPFELVSLLLTVAFIGSIIVAKKEAE